jgi:hypothetical protein
MLRQFTAVDLQAVEYHRLKFLQLQQLLELVLMLRLQHLAP